MILDLDVVQMVRSDPKRKSTMIDNGTPMVSGTVTRLITSVRTARVWCACFVAPFYSAVYSAAFSPSVLPLSALFVHHPFR